MDSLNLLPCAYPKALNGSASQLLVFFRSNTEEQYTKPLHKSVLDADKNEEAEESEAENDENSQHQKKTAGVGTFLSLFC